MNTNKKDIGKDIKKASEKHNLFGILSIILGVLGIAITIASIVVFKKIISLNYENMILLVKTLNALSTAEIFVKPSGVISCIIGLFYRSRIKYLDIFGIILNLISISWTLLIILT